MSKATKPAAVVTSSTAAVVAPATAGQANKLFAAAIADVKFVKVMVDGVVTFIAEGTTKSKVDFTSVLASTADLKTKTVDVQYHITVSAAVNKAVFTIDVADTEVVINHSLKAGVAPESLQAMLKGRIKVTSGGDLLVSQLNAKQKALLKKYFNKKDNV